MTVDSVNPSSHAVTQYAGTSDKLAARLEIHKYNTHPQHWFEWAGERLAKVGDVLEVGSGTGELWTKTPHADAKLVLTDFSDAMCAKIRAAVPDATVRQASATELPFPDASFDSVVANHMLYHVDDPDAALREFKRVLRPGGRVNIALNGMTHLDQLLEVGAQVGRPSIIRSQARITAENAKDYLSVHFENVVEERCPGGFECETADPVLAYINSLGDEPLTPEQVEKGRKLVDAAIARDGVFKISKNMVLFTGQQL